MKIGQVAAAVALSSALSSYAFSHDAVNVCSKYPQVGQAVLNSVNLSWPGLEAVQRAAAQGLQGNACTSLAAYYATGRSSAWLRVPPVRPGIGKAGGEADDLLNDIFKFGGVATVAKVPRNADGGLDWYNKGPNLDVEFMNCLNRHDSFVQMLGAWRATGNPIYVKYFESLVKDWVLHLPCRAGVSRDHWNTSGSLEPCPMPFWGTESPWRSLETGIRTHDVWARAFFGFQQAEDFSIDARVLLLLGMSEHNAVLHSYPSLTSNWAINQWAGLAMSCLAFPELMNAEALLQESQAELERLLNDVVYPDGMEDEQAFGYGMWTASDFLSNLQLLRIAGHELPQPSFTAHLEEMFHYGVMVSDQHGYAPRNGDADLGKSGWNQAAYDYFKRADWLYVHTNGREGSKPAGASPSVMFPWGGHCVLKSGFDKAATWALFDVGPSPGGHAHRAKLSLNVRANGSMLLVDSGRFAYSGNTLSHTLQAEYAHMTHAHNTLTIDGKSQQAAPKKATEPIPSSSWSFTEDRDSVVASMGLFENLTGTAMHTRAVIYMRGRYFVVIDQVASDRARAVQATWHAHPNSTVARRGDGAATVLGVSPETGLATETCIDVILATGAGVDSVNSKLVRGQNKSSQEPWQGWYSQTYDGAWPSPTLVYDFQTESGDSIFAWLLVPRSTSEAGDAAILSVSASPDGRVDVQVSVRHIVETISIDLHGPSPTLVV